ncbi:hypothetical protein ACFY7V_03730 [[Kitasatospora] papulosa]|uniref:hypothetical protein n=1 Tax=Streptomyces TaxID=1883 RepID=UPI002FEFCA5F
MFGDPEIQGGDAEELAAHFVRVWAEAVIRQAIRTREVRKRSELDDLAWERNDNWTLTASDLDSNWRRLWAEEHTLVWSAYQLERWQARLAKERGVAAPEENEPLRRARNALEHLDELHLEDYAATVPADVSPKAARRMAISGFPEQMLSFTGSVAAEVLDPETLDREAMKVVGAIEDELDERAAAAYLDYVRGR